MIDSGDSGGGASRVLVTGASGFVGDALLRRLVREPAICGRGAYRNAMVNAPPGSGSVCGVQLGSDTDWRAALEGVSAVVHAAARVHVMKDTAADPLAEFRRINVEGTRSLARQAAAAGVRRFVFISSIKVNGEDTRAGEMFSPEDAPAPVDPYGVSKMEAEDALRVLAAETRMEVVIVRPPLVYGPGVKANFLSMMRWLDKGVPLPLGAIDNRRSLVALNNLVDLIVTCIDHPAAANQTFLVSDGEDLSTTDLLVRTAAALGRKPRLLPVPAWLLEAGAAMVGRRDVARRLVGSLQVDIGKTCRLLDWRPPVTVDEALKLTTWHFREHQSLGADAR